MSDKPELNRAGTMAVTAKEGSALLDAAGRPDEDAHTRGQQKKIDDIKSDKKDTTKKKKGAKPGGPKKMTSMAQTAAEAKEIIGKDLDLSGGRSLRKRPPVPEKPVVIKKAKKVVKEKKPDMKKEGTMQKTAKEGKEFLKRGRKPKAAAKKGKAGRKPAPKKDSEGSADDKEDESS